MILSIQYMRAIAALLVVVNHAAWKGVQYSTDPFDWFNKIGNIGVDIFFIISGYIMCVTTVDRNLSISKFLYARFMRIIPLYWILTAFALLVYLVFPGKVNSSGGDTNVILSFLLIPGEGKFLLRNGWTLSYEFLFYLVFSFGLISKGVFRYVLPISILVSLTILGSFANPSLKYLSFALNPLVLEFVMGMLTFLIFRKRSTNVVLGVVFIVLGITVAIWFNRLEMSNRILENGIPAWLFFIGMLNVECWFQRVQKGLIFRVFRELGDSSYSLYLIHPFALTFGAIVLNYIGLDKYGYFFVIILILAATLSGHVCYLYLERVLLRLFKQKSGSRKNQRFTLNDHNI